MTIKYLAGNRVQGTNADRFAVEAYALHNYATGAGTPTDVTPRTSPSHTVDFDGAGSLLEVGNRTDFAFLHDGSSWSIRVRVLPHDTAGGGMILNTNGTTNTNLGLQFLSLSSGGNIRVRISDGSAGDLVTNTVAMLTNDAWSEIVVTYNGTNLILYENGGSGTSASNSNNNHKKDASYSVLRIGAASDHTYTTSENFDGVMDEIGIWKDRVLTPTEITALYNSGTNRLCSYYPENLKLYLNFNVDIAGKVNDNWLKNKAPVFPDGTIFEETDTGRSYIYDSDSGTTNTAKDFWTEIT